MSVLRSLLGKFGVRDPRVSNISNPGNSKARSCREPEGPRVPCKGAGWLARRRLLFLDKSLLNLIFPEFNSTRVVGTLVRLIIIKVYSRSGSAYSDDPPTVRRMDRGTRCTCNRVSRFLEDPRTLRGGRFRPARSGTRTDRERTD